MSHLDEAAPQCAHVFFEETAQPDSLLEQKREIDKLSDALQFVPASWRQMFEMRMSGQTYGQIGKHYCLSRERVRQIILDTARDVRSKLGIRDPRTYVAPSPSSLPASVPKPQLPPPPPPPAATLSPVTYPWASPPPPLVTRTVDDICFEILTQCADSKNVYGATMVRGKDATECATRLWKAGLVTLPSFSDGIWIAVITQAGREHISAIASEATK